MKKLLFVIANLAISRVAAGADPAPALQWVKTFGGAGNNSVASAAGDNRGNLYLAGTTTSLDFPIAGAAQGAPGGSTLARITLATGNGSRLFPANLPSITAVAASPANSGTLYAASGSQIWKSIDSGSTWSVLSGFTPSVSIFGLAVNPTRATNLYAGTSTAGVQRSNDGGLTWTAVNNGIPAQADRTINVQSVWVDPSAPNVIFASSGFGLMRSADAGDTWAAVAAGSLYSPLAFDPFTAGVLYFGSGNDILKSTDHGGTFVRLSVLPNQAGAIALAVDPHLAGVVYAGSTAGLFISSDGGGSWKLEIAGVTTVLAADPNSETIYAGTGAGIVRSSDRFATLTPIGLNQPSVIQLVVSGPDLFAVSSPTTDVAVMKLDSDGNVVYSTYFGGSGTDQAVALAVGSDGSLYVAGSTNSSDLPGTGGAYLSKPPLSSRPASGFVFKLNPRGQLDWATYFPESRIATIAVDASGNPLIAGATGGGLPTTPGAYQTDFQQTITSNGFFGVIGPTSAFVTKFNAQGSGLIYSTYVPTDNKKNIVQDARALAVDGAGNAWLGVAIDSTIAQAPGSSPAVVELNANGSAVVASAIQPGLGNVAALAIDGDSNVYIAGSYTPQTAGFAATPGAFQPAPQPAIPALPYQNPSGGGMDAFVAKWDSSLTHLLAATLLGGELPDAAASIAVDGSGMVIVSGFTDSKALPTRVPFQESFSSRAGFVAAFDASLSSLRFSTYLGDGRPFAAYAAIPDGRGNILVAGSTQNTGFPSSRAGALIVANKIALTLAPEVRLDSVQNYASHIAGPLAPGEPILAVGSGFGDGAQIVLDGSPLATISATDTSIVAVVPDATAASGVHTIQVGNHGTASNPIFAPAATASPGIYTADGSGVRQGYILNNDGTLNSPTNPAATGSAITIFIAGEGQYSVTDGYAVTPEPPAVFIDGFYCNGIAAKAGAVDGLPGNVYQLSVFVPDPAVLAQNDPDLKNFRFPPQSFIQLWIGPANSPMLSQNGVYINIK